MSDQAPLLGAYAAKQCPVRLFRQYDPTETAVTADPDDDLQQLFDDGIAFEDDVVAEIVSLHESSDIVVIPGRDELGHEERRTLTQDALDAAVPVICGALMAPDRNARRLGEIDILLATGRTVSVSAKPEYRAIDVKSHRCTINLADDADDDAPNGDVSDLRLREPRAVAGLEPRYREDDCLQLAHYHRLLQAAGYAETDDATHPVLGGILGSERVLAWFDLTRAQWSTITPQEDGDGIGFHKRNHHSTKRTTLDRYDFEFAFRVKVVDAARERVDRFDQPIVEPVKVKECERCDWRDVCDADLRERDDVSLVRSIGYPEWRVHRFMGVDTCAELAEMDPDEAVSQYADTPLSAKALRTQIHEARSVVARGPVVQPDWDETAIPRGDLEIDLDMENADHVYLWGALMARVPADWPEEAGTYVPFASFDPLDDDGEQALAEQLFAWITELLERADASGLTARVYFYSSVETTKLRAIIPSPELESLVSSDSWVDLLPLMKRKFWSNEGHGLKVMAMAHGFEWRDDDPGGFASMQWYADAIAGIDRDANIARILEYNEDDCHATAALRDLSASPDTPRI